MLVALPVTRGDHFSWPVLVSGLEPPSVWVSAHQSWPICTSCINAGCKSYIKRKLPVTDWQLDIWEFMLSGKSVVLARFLSDYGEV